MSERSCDLCSAPCCVAPLIHGFKKNGERCQHLESFSDGARCGIYREPERPAVCGAFRCAYIDGFGDAKTDRPDQCGVMFVKLNDGRVVAFEERPHGFERLRAKALLASIADPLVLVAFDGRQEARKNEGPR